MTVASNMGVDSYSFWEGSNHWICNADSYADAWNQWFSDGGSWRVLTRNGPRSGFVKGMLSKNGSFEALPTTATSSQGYFRSKFCLSALKDKFPNLPRQFKNPRSKIEVFVDSREIVEVGGYYGYPIRIGKYTSFVPFKKRFVLQKRFRPS